MFKRNKSRWMIGYVIEGLERRCLLSADLVPPRASLDGISLDYHGLSPPLLTSPSTSSIQIYIRYTDNLALAIPSIRAAQIRIVGPNGFDTSRRPTELVSSNGRRATAEYLVAPPGGSWDSSDDGEYQVILPAGAIKDKSGNAAAGGTLGSFQVAIPTTGSIGGMVQRDADWNGLEEVGLDHGVAGATVYVDANDDGSLNDGEISALADSSGSFELKDVLPGSYHIRVIPPTGYRPEKLPAPYLKVTVNEGLSTYAGVFLLTDYIIVDGTAGSDEILVQPDPAGLRITLNGVAHVESAEGVRGIWVRARSGDDNVSIDPGILLDCQIEGGAGADTLKGGGGNNVINGGAGNDIIFGGAGNDTIDGGGGDNQIHGGDGNDTIAASGRGHNHLIGDAGNDCLAVYGSQGKGWSILDGGAGNDQLFSSGRDILRGGSGNDEFFVGEGDTVDGGAGNDRLVVQDGVNLGPVRNVERTTITSKPVWHPSCFLTTAVVAWAGKADDCHELTVLRRFRDGYMRGLAAGPEMIRDYYANAPRVVEAIAKGGRGDAEWPRVYTMVQTAVKHIEAGRDAEALAVYAAEYLRLKSAYAQPG